MPDTIESLSQVPLFSKLERKDVKRIADSMVERSSSAGTVVVEEGKGGVGFFLIEEGEASVTIEGREVRKLGAGDHFGEIALIDDGPRSATVTAETDLRCLAMTSWQFKPLVQGSPGMAWPLLEGLVARLREAQQLR